MTTDKNHSMDTVKFFPIFLAASLSAVIDTTQVLIDEAVVGNLFDDVAFGSINLLEPYLLLELVFSYFICVSGPAMIVRARGEKNPEKMRQLFNHCITCDLIIGLVFSTVLTLFDVPLVKLVAHDTPAYPYALKLIYWNRYSFFVIPLFDFLFTYSVYLGGALPGSISMLVKMVLNTGLSIFLGKSMGIAGITCATFISNCTGLLILLIFVIYKYKRIHYRPYINPSYIKTLTMLSLPESSLFIAFFILETGANALALKTYSVQGIAVLAVIFNLFEVAIYVSEGISEYETAALNQAIGEGSRERLIYFMKVTFRAALIEGLVFSLLFLLTAPLLVRLFDLEEPGTVKITISAIRTFAIAPVAIIIIRVTAIFHQYTQKIGKAIMIWIFSIGLFPLMFVYLLSFISIYAMTLGFIAGPVSAVSAMWLFPRRNGKAPIDLKRTTVVFGDDFP